MSKRNYIVGAVALCAATVCIGLFVFLTQEANRELLSRVDHIYECQFAVDDLSSIDKLDSVQFTKKIIRHNGYYEIDQQLYSEPPEVSLSGVLETAQFLPNHFGNDGFYILNLNIKTLVGNFGSKVRSYQIQCREV